MLCGKNGNLSRYSSSRSVTRRALTVRHVSDEETFSARLINFALSPSRSDLKTYKEQKGKKQFLAGRHACHKLSQQKWQGKNSGLYNNTANAN